MSNIDKQALNQEKIEWLNKLADMEYCKSNPGHWLMSLKDTNMLAKLALRSVALLDKLEAAEKLNAELMEKQRLIDICQGQGLEHRIAAEKRAEAAEKRIAELESAGELSIREQKFLKLAKAYQQLAAENVALKAAFNKPDAWLSCHSIPPTYQEPDRGGEYLAVHEQPGEKNDDGSDSWPVYAKPEIETPATDRIVAGIKADAIDEAAVELDRVDTVASTRVIGFKLREFAKQLREGADK